MSFSSHTLVAVGGLLFSSLAVEFTSHPSQEIITECVCWCMILAFGYLYSHHVNKGSRPFNPTQLGPIAFGITLLCLTSSLQQTIWFTAPLLAPALVMIEKKSTLLPEHEEAEKEPSLKSFGLRKSLFLALYALVTMIALVRPDNVFGFRLKICWLFAQVILFYSLYNRALRADGFKSESIAEALQTATELATYMGIITVPLAILWWERVPSLPLVAIIGLMKACRWMSIIVLAHDARLSVAAWSTIFAVCTNAVWVYPHGIQTGLTMVSAFLALYRVATTFPQSSLGKIFILGFVLCPLWAFGIQNGMGSRSALWHGTPAVQNVPAVVEYSSVHHPIYHLAEAAKARFDETSSRQSKSLDEAVTEYTRRYGRAPPPGFDDWYAFATENEVQWIDEYDYLTKAFEPYWQMPPKVLREYLDQALSAEGSNLNTLTIKNGKASLSGHSFQHAQLVKLIEPIMDFLPDLKAALNEPDEPRVLVPYDILHSEKLHATKSANVAAPSLYFSTQDQQRIWNSVTLSCPADSPARAAVIEPQAAPLWPRFVSSLPESQDICLWPASSSCNHGFLASPSTFHYTDRLAPIMSTAKLSSFQDLMIPSSYYFQDDIASYDESKDIPWEQKKDIVYWRGSGTGGHWTHGSWKFGHRQRFVNFTNAEDAEILLLTNTPGKWTPYKSAMSQVINKFKVAFSGFIQCDAEDCKAQEDYFKKAEHDSNNDANSYKILYNLDGNSFSGRYYRFLKSNSLVFMQALFKEWHDDRLIPWLHFVPIGNSMEELPETARWLLDEPEGKQVAKMIADESKSWSRRILREVDLTSAYFRVFLEYKRLLSDERDDMKCCSS